jgi:ABC-type sugar transport system substrate-binding protein
MEKQCVHLDGYPRVSYQPADKGYEWGLEQNCPDVKVVGKQTAEWDRAKAVDVATAALQQHPEINIFMAILMRWASGRA